MPTATAEALSAPAQDFLTRTPGRLLIGGEWVEPADGRTFATVDPATGEEICQVGQGGAEDVARAAAAAQAAMDGPLRKMHAGKALGADERPRGARQGERGRARRARVARQRQAAGRRQGRRRRDGQPPALLRRLADEDRGRDDPGLRPRRPLLHAARAGRRLRPDHPVELPAADGGVEGRAGARGRMRDRPEAGRADAADRPAPRRARAGGRASGGRPERRHRRRRDRGRAGRRPGRRTRSRSPAPPWLAGRSPPSAGGP